MLLQNYVNLKTPSFDFVHKACTFDMHLRG